MTVSIEQWRSLTARFNLAGSLLSAVADLVVIVCMTYANNSTTSTRSRLLICLFIGDFVNGVCNSVAAVMALRNELHPGSFCDIEGFLAQWSVQISDLTTLALAVTTFLIARAAVDHSTLARRLAQLERASIYLVIALLTIPIITASIGYLLVGMAPTQSWCWFAPQPAPLATYVRYGLTHGPRMVIIIIIVTLYTHLFFVFKRRIDEAEEASIGGGGSPAVMSTAAASPVSQPTPPPGCFLPTSSPSSPTSRKAAGSVEFEITPGAGGPSGSGSYGAGYSVGADRGYCRGVSQAYIVDRAAQKRKAEAQRAAIVKLLIYPACYTLLWLPGIVNRIAEATNQSPEVQAVTGFCQFTTQFVGLANAIIYGFSVLWAGGGGSSM
ncbi:hypothetical protein HK101_009057 [Irineochytrium annulatum]|nr:hypothetical protein HK101_009057 [Irineochytrium annulatum]